MATRKTWVWIIVGTLAAVLTCLIAVAGAGVYFVTRHIKTERSSGIEAIRAFDSARALFPNQPPIYELDEDGRPKVLRPLVDLPTSGTKPEHVRVLAWDPDNERLVNLSLPFWMLRLGHSKMDVVGHGKGFDLERVNLDADELERVGPALVFDFRNREGVRVLLWTQ